MTNTQEQKIKELIAKYNDILMHSMRIAIAEDFLNLIILNHDDSEFELSELMQKKEDFYNVIMKEFLKQNSSAVLEELKQMEDPTQGMKKRMRKSK